jgi:single-stranded-DNA-specific exonuclease
MSWPVDDAALEAARALIRSTSGPIAVACHNDVDGITAAVLCADAIERLGKVAITLVAARGEHVHTDAMRARIRAAAPAALIVCDMGSRGAPIVPEIPTVLIDHHVPAGFPEGAIVLSAHGHEPVAPSGLIAWHLVSGLVELADRAWLAMLSAVADYGHAHNLPLPPFPAAKPTHVRDAISLLNAARRAPVDHATAALAVLRAAKAPIDIARGKVEGAAALEECRKVVAAETDRCARRRPKFAKPGPVALLRFRSAAQVHPLVAQRWIGKLRNQIVMAANDGHLPGRICFSFRTASSHDIVAYLRGLDVGTITGDFGYGHPKASGGILVPEEFARVLGAMGLPDEPPAN